MKEVLFLGSLGSLQSFVRNGILLPWILGVPGRGPVGGPLAVAPTLGGLGEQAVHVAALPLHGSVVADCFLVQLMRRKGRLIIRVIFGDQALMLLKVSQHGAPLFLRGHRARLARKLAGRDACHVAECQVLANLEVVV